MNFIQYSTDELASYMSDYHKDVYGFRPRHIAHDDREAIISEIISIDNYMEMMRSTPEGRERLREDGWNIPEEDDGDYSEGGESDDGYALASAGFGTDEDYGCYGGTD